MLEISPASDESIYICNKYKVVSKSMERLPAATNNNNDEEHF